MRRRARVDANHGQSLPRWIGLPRPPGGLELIEVEDGAKALSRQRATKAEAQVYELLQGAGVRVRYVNSVEQIADLRGVRG